MEPHCQRKDSRGQSRPMRRAPRPSHSLRKSYHTLRRGLLSLKKSGHHFSRKNNKGTGRWQRSCGRRNSGHYCRTQQHRYHEHRRSLKCVSPPKCTLRARHRRRALSVGGDVSLGSSALSVHDANDAVHRHIRYFEAPYDVVPPSLLPHVMDTADHSLAFYYEDVEGRKCVVYSQSGECGGSGEARFVFISRFDIDSQTVRHLDRFPCSSFFKAAPKCALDRDADILHLIGKRHGDDDGKVLSFSMRSNSMLSFRERVPLTEMVPLWQLLDCHFEGGRALQSTAYIESVAKLNDSLCAEDVLWDEGPGIDYKRFLLVPELGKLLRFGGDRGLDASVHFVDLKGETAEWRRCPFRLPGSALTMHFVLGYDHLLFVFDVKGGGEGKIWIVDLLFDDHRVDRALKELDRCFSWDFGLKISTNFVQFINASRFGELMINLSEIMPPSMSRHYDLKTRRLVEGYCRAVAGRDGFCYVFPTVLIAKIWTFYPPFF